MTEILTCRNLTRNFGHFSLKDISFSIESGYLTGVIGSNGSGKTALLRILSGMIMNLQEPRKSWGFP